MTLRAHLFHYVPVFHFWPDGCNDLNHIATGHGGRDNCGHHVSASIFFKPRPIAAFFVYSLLFVVYRFGTLEAINALRLTIKDYYP